MRVSASAASSSGGLGLLLLEDSAEKSSVVISASFIIGQVVGAIDKLNRDPEGTAVILAAASADTGDITGCFRGSTRHDVGCSQTAESGRGIEAVWQFIVHVDTALARRGDALSSVWVQAEDVPGHGGLMPEVHDDSEVVRVRTSSKDLDGLVLVFFFFGGRVAVSCPDDVGAIVRENFVAAVSTEDGVPAGSSVDII